MLPLIMALTIAASTTRSIAETVSAPSPERSQELLFDAAAMGRTDLVAGLVAAGADVNRRDPRGYTPIILASYNGHPDTMEALIAAKGDPCLADASQGNTAQMGVAFKGDDATAARLLRTGCDVNARNAAGQTALMMAALFGRQAQITMLMASGADPSLKDMQGRTAISLAVAQGNDPVVKLLEGTGRATPPVTRHDRAAN